MTECVRLQTVGVVLSRYMCSMDVSDAAVENMLTRPKTLPSGKKYGSSPKVLPCNGKEVETGVKPYRKHGHWLTPRSSDKRICQML